ncbi:MAG: hypothetical protein AAF429_05215 [Pseudomonadota bacterium]
MAENNSLPASLTRPLYIGLFGLLISMGLFGIWSVYAPLASTIHTSGTLVSEKPNFVLQHHYGGKVADVYVRQHDRVAVGDPILEFDTHVLRENHAKLTQSIALIKSENIAIEAILMSDAPLNHLRVSAANDLDKSRFQQRLLAHQAEVNALRAEAEALQNRADHVTQKLRHLDTRIASVETRSMRNQQLVAKDALTRREAEQSEEHLAALNAERTDEQIQKLQFAEGALKAKASATLLEYQFRDRLLEQRAQNQARLLELEQQDLNLTDEIDAAILRAPIEGAIVSLEFDTVDMFAPRGSDIVTLSDNLENPQADLLIPPSFIDQVAVGRSGKLMVPALPQRNLPQVNVILTAISPDVEKSAEGEAIGYRARAEINHEDLERLRKSLSEDLILANGMPISVAIAGRETTFAQYLILPFFKAFDGALID